jgi:hypothetical protein
MEKQSEIVLFDEKKVIHSDPILIKEGINWRLELKCWYIRRFRKCVRYYGTEKMDLMHVWYVFKSQPCVYCGKPLRYIYVGKSMMWITYDDKLKTHKH